MLVLTALHIACKKKSYSEFADMDDLQKSNGMKFLEGKTHRKMCEFITEVIRSNLKKVLLNANFFSILNQKVLTCGNKIYSHE